MSRKKKFFSLLSIAIFAVVLSVMSDSLMVKPANSCYGPPCWCRTIMKDTSLSGLFREGERQTFAYIGMGEWDSYEVCNYIIWRWWNKDGVWKRDLQAHIELANLGGGVYRMEIYHSWPSTESEPIPIVTMPYYYTVLDDYPHLLVLIIEADIC